jgi:hypothetical protein
MTAQSNIDKLIEEGDSESVDGWDFSWLSGRATEARPSWKYFESLGNKMSTANAVLDIQTGGGERFAEILSQIQHHPKTLAVTESWPPNIEIARNMLEPYGVSVVEAPDDADLLFEDETFDLVCSRHPTVTLWTEIERVLQFGGTYFSQQVGAGTNSELSDFIMGPRPISTRQSLDQAISLAVGAGLEVINAHEECLPVVFFDIGAVVYFLRKVIWTVPDFSVVKYRERLIQLHGYIEQHGSFNSHSQRYLIETRKPS